MLFSNLNRNKILIHTKLQEIVKEGKPGMLQSTASQRVRHDLAAEQQQQMPKERSQWKRKKETYCMVLLLLLLSRFSRVQLCATPQTMSSPPGSPVPGILQARTLEWVAISFSNAWKVKSESEVAQSCPTLSDPMDCSPPGSSIHGIFQARVLEWGAIAFSKDAWRPRQFWLLW